MENLLPNGSIVLLKGGNKRLMIYGRKQLIMDEEAENNQSQEEDTNELMYDYLGVFYPEGYINEEYTFVFNHADIIDIIFHGYADEEEEEFQEVLRQA